MKLIDTTGTTTITNYALKDNGVLLRTRGAAAAEEDYVETSWPVGRQNVGFPTTTAMTSMTIFPGIVREVALSIASRLMIQGARLRGVARHRADSLRHQRDGLHRRASA